MYGYNIRGWKGDSSNSSSSSSVAGTVLAGHYHPTSSPAAAAEQSWKERPASKFINEEDEMDAAEENDVAAPLPSERPGDKWSVTDDKQTKHTPGKGIFAKDKRRLREKRRSTGVATLQVREGDEETTRNTSFNESAASEAQALVETSHQPDVRLEKDSSCPSSPRSSSNGVCSKTSETHGSRSTPSGIEPSSPSRSVQALRIDDSQEAVKESSLNSPDSGRSGWRPLSSDFSKNLTAKPFEPKRGILKSIKPATAAKPVNLATSAGQRSDQQGQRSTEEILLRARLAEMEKSAEADKRENAVLKRMLDEKDSKIRDLEIQIVTLNEDLDLADEDYLQLEEENRALARALAHVNSALVNAGADGN